jgi:hypothetical protein
MISPCLVELLKRTAAFGYMLNISARGQGRISTHPRRFSVVRSTPRLRTVRCLGHVGFQMRAQVVWQHHPAEAALLTRSLPPYHSNLAE